MENSKPIASELVEDLEVADAPEEVTGLGDNEEVDEAKERLIQTRTDKFMELFDKMESESIDLVGPEATSIARSATSEFGVAQRVDNLADLKVEDLSEYEMKRIISRARSAIKRVLELRTKFAPITKTIKKDDGTEEKVRVGTAGPFYSNRKIRRERNKKSGNRASSRTSRASELVKQMQSRKGPTMNPGKTKMPVAL